MHDPVLAPIVLLFFASELTLAILRRSRRAPGATQTDSGSLHLLWIVITLAIFAANALSGSRPGFLPFPPAWRRAVALPLFAVGLGVRWWAVITLGKFFTIDVATHDDHTLVATGPFRFVRHPSYTGLLLAFLGFGVSLGNAVSVVVLIAPIALTLAYRMRVEEAVLRKALGASYEAYCARTKRLIPGLI